MRKPDPYDWLVLGTLVITLTLAALAVIQA